MSDRDPFDLFDEDEAEDTEETTENEPLPISAKEVEELKAFKTQAETEMRSGTPGCRQGQRNSGQP